MPGQVNLTKPRMAKTKHIVRVEPHREEVPAEDTLAVGQWYWVASDEDTRWLGCVVHRGSNFIKVEGVTGSTRIHVDDFWRLCTFEPYAESYIKNKVQQYQEQVRGLMGKVQEITARLGMNTSTGNQHTKALATMRVDVKSHKKALIQAKEKDLPELFQQIYDTNKSMAVWMTAPTIPLKAQAYAMRQVVGTIDQRIFHVELYAGLIEEVITVQKGKAAPASEKLKLLQRRHYMDEECLLDYQAGGMEFENLHGFDKWLCKRKNLERILPFPRCIVAFKVRRHKKYREHHGSISDFIRISAAEERDKNTFLYIRNGEQVFRLGTAIEFEEKLFPDADKVRFHGKLWVHSRRLDFIIDQNRYDNMGEEFESKRTKYRADCKAYAEAKKRLKKDTQYWDDVKEYEARFKGKTRPGEAQKQACENLLKRNGFKKPYYEPEDERKDFKPFDATNVYYDDATQKLKEQLDKHNRLALLLQGLFDRSPVLHPHPKVRLWEAEGFDAAVELIYDADRALHAGPKPDFEAYRRRCNASIKTGTVTYGQHTVWMEQEAEKENARQAADRRINNPSNYRYYQPYGNPGPGDLARVCKMQPRTKKCEYRWTRKRLVYRGWPYNDRPDIKMKISVDSDRLFNVEAYKPGDFLQFFQDTRTREEYLEWAPMLLTAEDYHAGKKALREDDSNDGENA